MLTGVERLASVAAILYAFGTVLTLIQLDRLGYEAEFGLAFRPQIALSSSLAQAPIPLIVGALAGAALTIIYALIPPAPSGRVLASGTAAMLVVGALGVLVAGAENRWVAVAFVLSAVFAMVYGQVVRAGGVVGRLLFAAMIVTLIFRLGIEADHPRSLPPALVLTNSKTCVYGGLIGRSSDEVVLGLGAAEPRGPHPLSAGERRRSLSIARDDVRRLYVARRGRSINQDCPRAWRSADDPETSVDPAGR